MRKQTMRPRGLGLVVAIITCLLVSSLAAGSAQAVEPYVPPVPIKYDRCGLAMDEFEIQADTQAGFTNRDTGAFVPSGRPISTNGVATINLVAMNYSDRVETYFTLTFTGTDAPCVEQPDTLSIAVSNQCTAARRRSVLISMTNTLDGTGIYIEDPYLIATSPSRGTYYEQAKPKVGRIEDGATAVVSFNDNPDLRISGAIGLSPGEWTVKLFDGQNSSVVRAQGHAPVAACGQLTNEDQPPSQDEGGTDGSSKATAAKAKLKVLRAGVMKVILDARPVASRVQVPFRVGYVRPNGKSKVAAYSMHGGKKKPVRLKVKPGSLVTVWIKQQRNKVLVARKMPRR